MFDSIKQSLAKSDNAKFLRFEPGNTYTVRLLPNVKDPTKTFFHYFTFGWKSLTTGEYITVVSPQTYGERDPVNEYRFKLSKSSSEADQALAKSISRKENWAVNAYIVSDPKNSNNNGTVKLIRFGRQLHGIIMEALEGEDALGTKIFDLSKEGCDFKIKVEKQGDFPTFVSSKFSQPKAIEGMNETKIKEVYNSVIDIEKVITVKSYDEIVKVMNDHLPVGGVKPAKSESKPTAAAESPAADAPPISDPADGPSDGEDDQINALLDQLKG